MELDDLEDLFDDLGFDEPTSDQYPSEQPIWPAYSASLYFSQLLGRS